MPLYRLPYQDVFQQGIVRPYLKLHVTGLNGAEGDIWGLLDTGADATALPDGFRALMGYGAGDVAQTLTGLANGAQISTWVATRPVVASVSGLAISFELWPTFVQGPGSPLWGR